MFTNSWLLVIMKVLFALVEASDFPNRPALLPKNAAVYLLLLADRVGIAHVSQGRDLISREVVHNEDDTGLSIIGTGSQQVSARERLCCRGGEATVFV